MNQQRATEGKTEWGRRPSPAQLPRTQHPGPERCLLHPTGVVYRQAGGQANRPSPIQAGRQAGRRCRFAMRERQRD